MSWRADVPDSVNVLDGVADLLAELFLIKLHLQEKQRQQGGSGIHTFSHRFIDQLNFSLSSIVYFLYRFPNVMSADKMPLLIYQFL